MYMKFGTLKDQTFWEFAMKFCGTMLNGYKIAFTFLKSVGAKWPA